jgi:hypothetical protein
MAESVAHGGRSTSCVVPLPVGTRPSAARTGRTAVTTVVACLRETRSDSPVINPISGAAA